MYLNRILMFFKWYFKTFTHVLKYLNVYQCYFKVY
jgi:hypothetical protein